MELKTSHTVVVRLSEVDSMRVVWHGSYPLYFEDAREAFGKAFGLEYMHIADNGFFAPLVELNIKYLRPLVYSKQYRVDIVFRPTEAAKIVFDYEIYDPETGLLHTTAHSVQVFMDMQYQLLWYKPDFYVEWETRHAQRNAVL